jgi:hypothetical protein
MMHRESIHTYLTRILLAIPIKSAKVFGSPAIGIAWKRSEKLEEVVVAVGGIVKPQQWLSARYR